jgi:amino acid transporter
MLRYIMLLVLVVWLGSIIFFGAVMAPVLFKTLPSNVAGDVVAPSLRALHWMGLAAGIVFVAIFVALSARLPRTTFDILVPALIFVMLLFTAVSQFYVIPQMETLRPQMAGYTYTTPLPDWEKRAAEARQEFDLLHRWSTRLEAAVLILGLVVLAWFARPETPVRCVPKP